MLLFACDWCKAIKQPEDAWVLGLAAESIGITAARREINILSSWDDAQACHPLAVHFCSLDHKDRYMAALFDTEPLPEETVIETETTVTPAHTAQSKYVRTASAGVVAANKRKPVGKAKRRRAA